MDLTSLLDALLRGATAALAALLASALWPAAARAQPPDARLALALLCGLAVQTVAGHPGLEAALPRPAIAPLVGVAVGNAVLFAALAQALFDPRPGRAPLVAGLWLAAVALGSVNVAAGCGQREALWAQAMVLAQRALPAVAAAVAVAAALRGRAGDLLEPRRRLRHWLAWGGAVYTVAQLALRLGQPGGRLQGLWALADSAALLAVLGPVAVRLLGRGLRLDWLGPRPSGPAAPPGPGPAVAAAPDRDDTLVAERLAQALAEGVHRQGELTIAGLAGQLRCPEYRLRRVIRDQLGHDHFNQFLHHHRLADACAALADPARRDEPVLSVALSVGYQSIGPFNRAFKAATGLTPSAWRRQALADS